MSSPNNSKEVQEDTAFTATTQEEQHQQQQEREVVYDENGNEITAEMLEQMRRENIAAAEEIMTMIKNHEVTQNYWKEELERLFAQEAEEDERARELFAEVMVGEAEAMSNPKFMKWMAEREKFGVGREVINTWYENENLLMACPYLAVVPYPRQLTPEGQQFLAETIDDLCLGCDFVIEAHPTGIDFATASNFTSERKLVESGGKPLKKLRTGGDVLQAIEESETLRSCLEETSCIFINDVISAVRPEKVFCAQCFVVRGRLVAIQLSSDVPEDRAQECGTAIEKFFAATINKHLQQRTFVFLAQVDCAVPEIPPGVFLLNLGFVDVQAHGRFAWSDLMGAVVSGGDENGRPIVRVAGATGNVAVGALPPTATTPADGGVSKSAQLENQPAAPAPAPVQTEEAPAEAPKHVDPEPATPTPAPTAQPAAAAPQGHSTTTLMAVAAFSAVAAVGASVLINRRN